MLIRMVEVTNRCNENCWFCPHTKMQRPQGDISIDTVSIAISKMVGMGQKQVCLNNLGEPLLHPKFFEIADMFGDAGIATCVTANSRALDDRLVSELEKSSLGTIQLSMDFAGDRENELVNCIIDDPRVSVNIKGATRQEIVDFRERWGSKALVKFITNIAGQMDFKDDDVLHRNCVFLDTNHCVLLWDGRISACCYDFDGNYILGTIDEVDKLHHREEYDLCKNCMGLDMRFM